MKFVGTKKCGKHEGPVEKSVELPGGVAVDLRLIPAGKFTIGSPSTENGHEGDERQRPEIISEPFYMTETQTG